MYLKFNCNVKIVDMIMGAGKTTSAINYINQADFDEKFLFITPYLNEVDRIRKSCPFKNFKEPKEMGTKLNGIKYLVSQGENTGKITGYKTKVGADAVFPFSGKLTIRGTMYAEARVYNGSSYTWTNFTTKSVVFSAENGQTNITIESGNGNVSGRSIDFIRSRLVINSVSID